ALPQQRVDLEGRVGEARPAAVGADARERRDLFGAVLQGMADRPQRGALEDPLAGDRVEAGQEEGDAARAAVELAAIGAVDVPPAPAQTPHGEADPGAHAAPPRG